MKEITSTRSRKCSDINMENPYFEVLDSDDNMVIFDISKSESGDICILFYKDISSKWIPIRRLEMIIQEAIEQFT